MYLPRKNGEDNQAHVSSIGETMMELQFPMEDTNGESRDAEIIRHLKEPAADGAD